MDGLNGRWKRQAFWQGLSGILPAASIVFLFLFDLRLRHETAIEQGRRSAENFTIDCINRDHRDICFVIVTGALPHLHAPTMLLTGNHYRRDTFARHFPSVKRDANGFVQAMHVFDEV